MKYSLSFLLLSFLTAITLLFLPVTSSGQTLNLGVTANFTLFTTVGAVGSTGISRIIGKVGTNTGAITGFDPFYNELHNADALTLQSSTDLLSVYQQLNSIPATGFPGSLLGNGQVIYPGVDSIAAAASLSLDLSFDALGNSESVFIIKIHGAFSTNANSKVHLINGALARNIYWQVEGAVSMATGTYMRGIIIANNGAISMGVGDTLEGRALSTTGAVSVYGSVVYAPGIVLPVTLLDFKAKKMNNVIEFFWSTTNEFSLAGYEIERSSDGHNFYTIGSVPATNTSFAKTYNWQDNEPLNVRSFYRLKMIDIDRVFKYSAIVKIEMNAEKGISVYPNPVTNHTLLLQMYGQPKGNYLINMYSSNGEKVMSSRIIQDGNDGVRTIALNKNLPPAFYYLEIGDPGKNRQLLKILVN
jgi:Ice-binding-like